MTKASIGDGFAARCPHCGKQEMYDPASERCKSLTDGGHRCATCGNRIVACYPYDPPGRPYFAKWKKWK